MSKFVVDVQDDTIIVGQLGERDGDLTPWLFPIYHLDAQLLFTILEGAVVSGKVETHVDGDMCYLEGKGSD